MRFFRSIGLYVSIICLFFFEVNSLYAQDSLPQVNPFLPDLDGIIKTKVEYDFNNALYRFSVRNARFGARGMVNHYFGYRVEVDLSDEGRIRMLDAFAKFIPLKSLEIYLGQRKVPFGTDYMRSPADNFFANRSFVAKYVNDGIRDIGAFVNYKTKIIIPVDIWVATVNGTGNNNPQWIDHLNFASRISVGDKQGLKISGNFFDGQTIQKSKLLMASGECKYQAKKWMIETEYVYRNTIDTLNIEKIDEGFYIHSYYQIKLNNKIYKYIMPVGRWDLMGHEIFNNQIAANRITAGITFGFEPKLYQAEIRLNYEEYLKGSLPIHTDKANIEFVVKF